MATKLTFNKKRFLKEIENATMNGLIQAGTFYHNKCREVVSQPNSGVQVERTKNTSNGPAGSKYTIYPSPSRPGEPPRLRTGWGRRNILIEINKRGRFVRVGIGINAMYMFWLEIGTRRVARRPWLVATLTKHSKVIGMLAATGKS